MSELTPNLKLFKYDTLIDGKEVFSIDKAMNDNWDIVDEKVVKKTGDIMSGNLSIKGSDIQHVFRCYTTLPYNEAPSSNTGIGKFQILDSDGVYCAQLGCERYTDNAATRAFIRAHSPKDRDTAAQIYVGIDNTNHIQTYAPSCSDLYSIVTTTGISKAAKGYVKFGNGIIIQWGTASPGTTVQLPISFSNTNFAVAAMSTSGNGCPRVQGITVSTLKYSPANFADANCRWIAIGY